MKTLVRAAGIVDGTGGNYRTGDALLMEGGRLLAAGPERELRVAWHSAARSKTGIEAICDLARFAASMAA